MKTLCVADLHGFHEQLYIPEDIELLIVAGDISNSKRPEINVNECGLALNWLDGLKIKHKILIAGNHDTSIEKRLINPKDFKSIVYLEHDYTEIEGRRIFGSPYTKEYFNWAFNVRNDRLFKYWESLEDNIDILITHGPPKTILDLGIDGRLEFCGDNALYNKVMNIKPKYHIFGHIHNNHGIINQGTRTIGDIMFINASCVTDGKFDYGLTSQGIIINI